MGTAASICVNDGVTPHGVYEQKIAKLQDKLREAGCFIPGTVREIPELTKAAKINLPEAELALLQNGIERPDENMSVNYATLNIGDVLEFDFGEERSFPSFVLYSTPTGRASRSLPTRRCASSRRSLLRARISFP